MQQPRRLPWARFLVVVLLVAADQLSKTLVLQRLATGEGLELDPHGHERLVLGFQWLALMTSHNRGAAFGRFADFPYVLVVGRLVAVLVLVWLLFKQDRRDRPVLWAMVLILAGAAGNLLDNLATGKWEAGHPFGLVRDFIDVWFVRWDWHFPTFNLADSCITVGAVVWIASGLFHRSSEEDAPEPSLLAPREDPPPPPPRLPAREGRSPSGTAKRLR